MIRMFCNEIPVDPVFLYQDVSDRIQQHQIRPRTNLVMMICVHGRFRAPGIDHDDLMSWDLIIAHTSPHDRMRYNRIRPDKDKRVRQLQILQCIPRGVISQRSLMRNGG